MSQFALNLIKENIISKNKYLDLGNCNIESIPLLLFDCIWLETLVLSNTWWHEKKGHWVKSRNRAGANNIKYIPFDIRRLKNLKNLIASGAHNANWEIKELFFLEYPDFLLGRPINWKHVGKTSSLDDVILLSSLNISYNRIDDLTSIDGQPELKVLDFSYNEVVSIQPIIRLTKIEILNCSKNYLTDASYLEVLVSLKYLNISHNRVKDFSSLAKLSTIRYLDIGWNNPRDFIFLKSLVNLEYLKMSSVNISNIEILENLVNLKSLDLRNNEIDDFIILKKLKKLTDLNLTSCKMLSFTPICELNQLKSLVLAFNKINDLAGIENLSNLSSLDLRYNIITSIERLKDCTSLQELDLAHNKIKEIDVFNQLQNLVSLNLSNNEISSLAGLGKLAKLKTLNLSYNNISEIKEVFYIIDLNSNIEINIEGNPFLKKLPGEVVKAGWPAIWDRLRALKNGNDFVEIREVKMLLLGNTNVGKSNLLEYFETNASPTNNISTHGIQYRALNNIVGKTIVNCWDFGGQDYFHATHRLFFSPGALNLVLWSKKNIVRIEGENCFNLDYWFRCIEQIVSNFFEKDDKNIEVVVVENKIDLQNFAIAGLNQVSFQNKFQNLNLHYTQINLKPLKLLPGFKDFLAIRMSTMYNKYQKVYKDYLAIIRKNNAPYMMVKEIDPSGKIEQTAIPVFRNMGILLHFPDLLPGKIFHYPQKLLDLLYEKVLSRKLKETNQFCISKTQIRQAISGNDLEMTVDDVLSLLIHFDLIFQIPQREHIYFIPQYLPEPTLENIRYKSDAYQDANIVIKSDHYLMNLAMLKLYSRYGRYAEENEMNIYQFWKDTIVIEKDHMKLLIEFNRAEDRIELHPWLKGKSFALANEIVEFLINVHHGYPEVSKSKRQTIPKLNWDSDKFDVLVSIDSRYFVTWGELVEKVRKKASEIEVFDITKNINERSGTFTKISTFEKFIPDLIKYTMAKKVFISYSHRDMEHKLTLMKYLDPLIDKGLIDVWNDNDISGGDVWDDAIKKNINDSDIYILIVSQELITSKYIKSVELREIIKKCLLENILVLPILVRNCDWKHWEILPTQESEILLMSKYQFLPITDQGQLKPIESWRFKDDAWLQVSDTIRSYCK